MTPAQHAQLAAEWKALSPKIQRALRDFARYPKVGNNRSFITGYVSAAFDFNEIDPATRSYLLALIGGISDDETIRNEVLAHAGQTVPLSSAAVA